MALASGSRRLAQTLLRPWSSAQGSLGALGLQQRGIAEPAAAEDTSLTVEVRISWSRTLSMLKSAGQRQ